MAPFVLHINTENAEENNHWHLALLRTSRPDLLTLKEKGKDFQIIHVIHFNHFSQPSRADNLILAH